MKRNPGYLLAALVITSFVVRTALAWLRSVPVLFPDEYIYSSIGRSIAESGRPMIRGGSAHFPALLQPIVTAPAWLIGDVDTAFRLVQATGSLSMSLAAVPVYLIARRLGLSGSVALVVAAFTLLVPDLLYASFITAEAFAYPLLLASVYAGARALVQPSRGSQLLFVAASGLTAFARIQFAILPIVFALATIVVGARERRVRQAVIEQAVPLVVFAIAAVVAIVSGPSLTLGVYRYLLGFHTGPIAIVHWAALDAMMLAYAAGWIIVPGAILGLWLAVARPRSRYELAFGVLTILFVAALLLEAGFLEASLTTVKEVQERYVFYAVPLLGLCFALYAGRGWPLRVQHLGLAACLVLVSVRLPLSGYAVLATLSGSPILFGIHWLAEKLGKPGDAAAVVAAAAGLMAAVAVLGSRRPRLGTPVVLALAFLATGAASAGAVIFDLQNTANVKKAYLPDDPSWVDRARVGDVTLLQSFSGGRANSLQELFWNRSITRVALLPGAEKFDSFRAEHVRVGGDGSLIVNGRPLVGPLLVDTYGSTVRLQDARVAGHSVTATLWRPTRSGRPRLRLYARGRYADGWLSASGVIRVWPSRLGRPVSGWLSMRLTASPLFGATTLDFQLAKGALTTVHVPRNLSQSVRIPVCSSSAARMKYRSRRLMLLGLRPVSVKSTAPIFTPDRSACASATHGPTKATGRPASYVQISPFRSAI